MVNNVIGVVNYVIAARRSLLNFMLANIQYRTTAGGATYSDAVADVKCAIRYLRAHARKHHAVTGGTGIYRRRRGSHLGGVWKHNGQADPPSAWSLTQGRVSPAGLAGPGHEVRLTGAWCAGWPGTAGGGSRRGAQPGCPSWGSPWPARHVERR